MVSEVTMSEFELVLRQRVVTAYRELVVARRAGLDYEMDLHRARLEDLFELASRNGVDAVSWVDLETEIPRQERR